MTRAEVREAGAPATGEVPWRRLDPRTALASGALTLGVGVAGGVPTVAGFAARGSGATALVAGIVVGAVVALVGVVVGAEKVRLARTRFRVGLERVELHSGILVRTRRSLPRERIRSVDVHADPVARVLGLATLRVDTARRASVADRPLELRCVRREEAEALRSELLVRRRDDETAGTGLLAALDPRWTRYAPLSFLTPALGAAAAGAVMQVAQWVGLESTVVDAVVAGWRRLGTLGTVAVGLTAVLVVGAVASVAAFVEAWWSYRLEREPSGTLRVRRGLLTTRSTTLEERRLRGVALVEPLGVRTAGAARVDAVATGLATAGGEERTDAAGLLPAAPRELAERVAAAVLREPVSPTRAAVMRTHPVAARGRRVRWATAGALVPALVLAALGAVVAGPFLVAAAAVAVAGLVAGPLLGRAAYRALGHAVHEAYVVVRGGLVRRRTVVLRRDGVIGWSVRQSWFQRRVGLATLWLTTAAGDQAYAVRDVAAADAPGFAAEVVGDVVRPFLTERHSTIG
ncbi:PH domain-containing protein [Actinomycetospora cinnamomea]|uniref:Putative membrane protein n=1 Tax=Actinomycetospora cinnamomea TaxID=663609 RepID=A0A2U1FHM1_9PSEU|nr:PH domain-containing protein [Actinomycetospora cinnamomea]PVZ11694.1 putative membrane protein [Actinomycetospora cinnamomea]